MATTDLTLADELLLRAPDAEFGDEPSSDLERALAAALLDELAQRGKRRVTEASVRLADDRPTGDSLLDEIVEHLAVWHEVCTSQAWIAAVNNGLGSPDDKVVFGLTAGGRLASLFPAIPGRHRYARASDAGTRLREHVRAVLLRRVLPDERTARQIALVWGAGLQDGLFMAEEWRRVEPIAR